MSAHLRRSALLVLAALLMGACTSSEPSTTAADREGLPVAPELQEFRDAHGGLALLGPALEAPRREGTRIIQAFTNAELVYDPARSGANRVDASALGLSLGLAEPPVPAPTTGQSRYFTETGHALYAGFAQAYQDIGGQDFAGPPIAEVDFRDWMIIQCFERLGFYREEEAAPSQVRLLAYGLAAHPNLRRALPLDFEAVLPPDLHSRPFAAFLDRYGGEAVFGQPLGEPYTGQDGALEQVFERAALFSPQGRPELARLRPLGLALGPSELGVLPSPDPESLYFPATGHTVQWAFARFYRTHDGERLLGLPLDEARMEGGLLTQRFENAILEYRYSLPDRLAVQLADLGRDYASASPAPTPTLVSPEGTPTTTGPGTVEVRTWVERPFLTRGEMQRIYLLVLGPDGLPWAGVVPVVQIEAPRSTFFVDVPPTDTHGAAQVDLAVPDLQPGEIVNYEIVVAGELGLGYAIGQFAGRIGP